MKKSKILVPALAALAFSTAASITGTVAWFTANRLATVTAGEFAIVNTSSALDVTLGTGVGTGVTDSGEVHTVTTTTGYKLTDGSFDHESSASNIVKPDITGTKIGGMTALASSGGTALERDHTNNVYTAFTWTITFKVTFGNSASKDLGLFLDLSSAESYMHKKVHFAAGDDVPGNTYYPTAACTGDKVNAANDIADPVDYYLPAPAETGKAFRIAFVPTAIAGSGTNSSIGYAKVWAKNETAANCGFINTASPAAVNDLLSDRADTYSNETISLEGNASSSSVDDTATAGAVGTPKVLMDSTVATGIPADGAVDESTALSTYANFLGVFRLDAGETVWLTYTCVAWFDGTDTAADAGHIVSNAEDFETIVTSMKFGVANLA